MSDLLARLEASPTSWRDPRVLVVPASIILQTAGVALDLGTTLVMMMRWGVGVEQNPLYSGLLRSNPALGLALMIIVDVWWLPSLLILRVSPARLDRWYLMGLIGLLTAFLLASGAAHLIAGYQNLHRGERCDVDSSAGIAILLLTERKSCLPPLLRKYYIFGSRAWRARDPVAQQHLRDLNETPQQSQSHVSE